ncbi:ROK family protein [Christiangramia crocea]|uniref:ROK family protein n=1 Tax=Christiangramia crocea TaxID=2904124 RepID=A0A9X1UXE2_9FLAO|nr:ROK family protein [Gramella crocea]MCG9971976.1 ROK family protein [Gramella crocea]
MRDTVIGIDIGATKIHMGIVNASRVIKDHVIPTSAKASKEQIIQEIIEGIEKLANDDFKGIGIGVPGLVNVEKGIIYDLWNIPSWKEVFLKDHLERYFNKPVKIINDANSFAMGEKKYGIGKDYSNFVGVSLGTGYGTGIIINNELYSGTLSGAGELANIPYLDKTIEDYCSGKFFRSHYGEEGSVLYKRAEEGDREALKAFDDFGKHLGESFKLILYVLAPEAIILGGSVSKAFRFFEGSLQERINSFPFKRITEKVKIVPSIVSDVSLLGPAALFDDDSAC